MKIEHLITHLMLWWKCQVDISLLVQVVKYFHFLPSHCTNCCWIHSNWGEKGRLNNSLSLVLTWNWFNLLISIIVVALNAFVEKSSLAIDRKWRKKPKDVCLFTHEAKEGRSKVKRSHTFRFSCPESLWSRGCPRRPGKLFGGPKSSWAHSIASGILWPASLRASTCWLRIRDTRRYNSWPGKGSARWPSPNRTVWSPRWTGTSNTEAALDPVLRRKSSVSRGACDDFDWSNPFSVQ